MTIALLVNGSQGKMGKEIIKTFEQDKEFSIAGTADKKDNLAEKIAQSGAQVVIDFTAASVGFQNASIIINAGAHPVIGTTGFLPDQIEELQKRCARQKLGGIIAPNFCIGVLLMMRFAEQAAKYYPHAEVIEMHHNTKEETPSGTGLHIAHIISKSRAEKLPLKKYKEIIPNARGANHEEVAVHSVRLPGLVAHETLLFGGRGELLTLKHDSLHRESFMPGIKLACKKVLGLQKLVYGLENFLD